MILPYGSYGGLRMGDARNRGFQYQNGLLTWMILLKSWIVYLRAQSYCARKVM